MPEGWVRGLGTVLAHSLSAMHALGRVHAAVTPDRVEVTDSGPRLLDPGDDSPTTPLDERSTPQAITEPDIGSTTDVFDLASVLVFAATGSLSAPVPPALREVIDPCLTGSPADRPTAADLARVLAAPAPARWLPAVPVTVKAESVTGPPSVPSRRRRDGLPWIIAAASWVTVILVVAGTATISAGRDASAPHGDFAADEVTDVCALLDLPAVEKLGGGITSTRHDDYGGIFLGSRTFTCHADLKHGWLSAELQIGDRDDTAQWYWRAKSRTFETSGAGVETGLLPGVGEDAYHSTRKTGTGDQLLCGVGSIVANAALTVDFLLSEDTGISRADLRAICERQTETAWGRVE
ncbi:hypothetical protein [Nocardia asteroides]|uniref:hypothetical protein n=1 Tax=Nocardia asteroides TaxID=1824 RepID=UPI001E475051|nr:hypothetical protein [Nocardia asteroides]UGT61805.1 hypothetical protein LTT61_00140 [Nocardia asteroides]